MRQRCWHPPRCRDECYTWFGSAGSPHSTPIARRLSTADHPRPQLLTRADLPARRMCSHRQDEWRAFGGRWFVLLKADATLYYYKQKDARGVFTRARHCRCRNRGAEPLSEYGITWMNGRAKRQRDGTPGLHGGRRGRLRLPGHGGGGESVQDAREETREEGPGLSWDAVSTPSSYQLDTLVITFYFYCHSDHLRSRRWPRWTRTATTR